MKLIFGLIVVTVFLTQLAGAQNLQSHFECKSESANSFRPFYLKAVNNGTEYVDYSKTPQGLLGQNAMTTMDECSRALLAANHAAGVICSRTGLDGWKPTLYTGTVPARADFGYLGGSSIMNFADCLNATKNSSAKGVCFWGGSDWYVSPVDREGVSAGPFSTIDACVQFTK